MKISIVTVCYNSEATIRDTIESVLSQTYSNIEHIIIDGASSDGTLSIINSYGKRISQIISEKDKGIYDAMNKGIEISSGDVVGILNSDDFYESNDVIAEVMKTLKENPSSSLVFGDLVFVNSNKLDIVTRFYNTKHFRSWKLRFGWMPPHPATFIRKTVYNSVAPYSLHYKISADYEMFVRLLMVHKLKYTHMNKTLVRMRSGGVSTIGISSNLCTSKEDVRACRENGIYTNFFMVLTRFPFKIFELIRKPKPTIGLPSEKHSQQQ